MIAHKRCVQIGTEEFVCKMYIVYVSKLSQFFLMFNFLYYPIQACFEICKDTEKSLNSSVDTGTSSVRRQFH